jgi:hypothetical protein
MSMCELIMRLSKRQLNLILQDKNYFWTLRDEWRGTDHCIDIDKAWHGIHFLFTNSAWGGPTPAKWIIFGKTPIPEFEGGYGPAHYLTPSQVSQVSELLENTPIEELKRRYDSHDFFDADIYPNLLWDEEDEEYLLYHYAHLKTLYQKAAKAGEYVVMIIG